MRDKLKSTFFTILLVAGMWRLSLFLIGILANNFFPYAPSFPYAPELASSGIPRWIFSWAGFDGVHYLGIALQGYLAIDYVQAFFPLFPLIIRVVHWLSGLHIIWSGLLVAHLSWLAMLGAWYLFLKEITSQQLARRWWWIILLLPMSFFWVSVYTESLFMGLAFLAMWCGIKGRWWWAAILIGLASASRVTGVFLIPALWVEWYTQQPTKNGLALLKLSRVWPLATISLGSLGLLSYMWFLARNFQDALYFFHVQSEFGAGRQEKIILLPQVFWRYLKIMATVRPINWSYFAYAQELFLSILSLLVLFFASKKVRPSVVVFSCLVWILPTLTGTFSSMPRYILACPAVLIMIVLWMEQLQQRRPWLVYLVVGIAVGWLCINTMLFIQGYWVA